MKNKSSKKYATITFSDKECKSIFDAMDMLDRDIYEFDVSVPGRTASCIGSAVAKLRNFNFDIDTSGKDIEFPLTDNELAAACYSLTYVLHLINEEGYGADELDDSLVDADFLQRLSEKIRLFLNPDSSL